MYRSRCLFDATERGPGSRDRYRSTMPDVRRDPEAIDRELEIQLQTELALARAERDAARVRARALRRARLRFALIVLVLAAISAAFIYLSFRAVRESFGA